MKMSYNTKAATKSKTHNGKKKNPMPNNGNFKPAGKAMGKHATHSRGSKKHG